MAKIRPPVRVGDLVKLKNDHSDKMYRITNISLNMTDRSRYGINKIYGRRAKVKHIPGSEGCLTLSLMDKEGNRLTNVSRRNVWRVPSQPREKHKSLYQFENKPIKPVMLSDRDVREAVERGKVLLNRSTSDQISKFAKTRDVGDFSTLLDFVIEKKLNLTRQSVKPGSNEGIVLASGTVKRDKSLWPSNLLDGLPQPTNKAGTVGRDGKIGWKCHK